MTDRTAATGEESPSADESFAALFAESLRHRDVVERSVVKGRVVAIENDMALIDVGLKAEGRVPVREFAEGGAPPEIQVGDEVEVYLEVLENRKGEAVLSRDKARREESWIHLEKAFKNGDRVTGTIFGRVKGGFTADLSGAVAFLPGSQVDIRPVRDITPLMGIEHDFYILKMDRYRGNIVVSRRAVLEESRAEARSELLANLAEGQVLEGIVKNLTDYGAFVDLGGVDGLLHVTDIAWRRINHPSESLSIGQTVKVQVIRFNAETQRISLGMKQLEDDPWVGVELKYPGGTRFRGRVTNITDYGAFVELEPGVEGLVHISEMSWTKKNVHPGKIVSTSQEIEVMVLDVDPNKRRISLGLKQCLDNPWETFAKDYPSGSEVEGEIRNITEFGLFIGLPGGIDGMVHMSDITWDQSGEEAIKEYKKSDVVKAQVLDVDVEKGRISLGIKQLSAARLSEKVSDLKRGERVTCTVSGILDNGIEVSINDVGGFIRKSELSRDRSEQRPDRYAVGEKVDARITSIGRAGRRLALSIKALELAEEKQAMAEYGSSDSGASLGDILGAAMTKASEEKAALERAQVTDQEPAKEESESEGKAPKKRAARKRTPASGEEPAAEASAEDGAAKKAGKGKAPKKRASRKKAQASGEEPATDASAEDASAEDAAAKQDSGSET